MISGQYFKSITTFGHKLVVGMAFCAGLVACQMASAQFGFNNGIRTGVVGGVVFDSQGAVRAATSEEMRGSLEKMRESVARPAGNLAEKTELRMISLSKLQAEIAKAIESKAELGEDVLYLAGLQRVEYVFVYPEENDIVLAGPAEGWVVRDDATVVGASSGRPVLQLEDLLTALRTTEAARQQPISVSIDPTPEGHVRLNRVLSQIKTGPGFNPAAFEPAMREAFGPQMVTLTSVASNSRMAHTLVASDYRMKRLAMDLEPSPVAGLPSYMEMIRDGGVAKGTQPRWWMACDYDSILYSQDRLAWKISGQGIKAMTEDELVDANGARKQTGQANKLAQRWADAFTKKFDELCAHNAAFGDLRNAMDLNIVATIISAHELEKVAGCDFGLLCGTAGSLETPEWKTPKTVSPECSFVRGRAGWTVSASGGVEINPWKIVSQQSKPDNSLEPILVRAKSSGAAWWWN